MTIFDGTTRPALNIAFEGDGIELTFDGTDVVEWQTMRGRRKRNDVLQEAVFVIAFNNAAGTYDVLKGGTQVAVTFTFINPDASSNTMYRGILYSVHQYRGLTPMTVVEVHDVLGWFRKQTLTPAYLNANGSEDVSTRAARIVTDYGLSGFAALEDSGYPSGVVMLSSFGNMTALEGLTQCAACAGGNYYTRADGSLQLSDPAERLTRTTVLALSDAGTTDTVPYVSTVMSPTQDLIVNSVTVYRPSRSTGAGQATTATYYTATRAVRWEAPVASDTSAQALACYLARLDSVHPEALAIETVTEVEIAGVDFLRNASTLTYADLELLEIGDKITVTRSGDTYTCTVEGIKHTSTPRDWKIRLYLSAYNNYSVDLVNGLGTNPGVGTFVYATPTHWTITSAQDTVRPANSLDIKWRDFSDRGAASGTLDLYANAKQEVVYDANSTGAYQFNCKGGSSTAMTTTMDMGQCVEFDVLVKCNNSAHYANATILIDGSSTGVTTIWLGGAPASGNAGGWDRYKLKVYQVNNTPTFRVVAERKSSA